tara:strand:+ start:392 stop:1066 length:675 start_codon:yes stop_codon:yes gene_type:complete
MVSIDTVYQKVLALANKEQRGYITPQEFNLFADQAQRDIFEQYFYDLNQLLRVPSNSDEYADIVDNLREKIAIFENQGTITGGVINAPNGLYRLGTLSFEGAEIEEVQQNEILYINNSYLTRPTEKRPVYVRTGELTVNIFPNTITNAECSYIARPTRPSWGYVVVQGKAMYDPTNRVDFQLHASEEGDLVNKILMYAGVSMKATDVAQAAGGLQMAKEQQEKQ